MANWTTCSGGLQYVGLFSLCKSCCWVNSVFLFQINSYEWNSIAHGSIQDKMEMLEQKIFGTEVNSGFQAPYMCISPSHMGSHWKTCLKPRPPSEGHKEEFQRRHEQLQKLRDSDLRITCTGVLLITVYMDFTARWKVCEVVISGISLTVMVIKL